MSLGPSCRRCEATEADCARGYPCCRGCTHFRDAEKPIEFGATGRREAVCGTEGGHTKHRRRGQRPCEACRIAHNEYTNAYKERRRALRRGEPTLPCRKGCGRADFPGPRSRGQHERHCAGEAVA